MPLCTAAAQRRTSKISAYIQPLERVLMASVESTDLDFAHFVGMTFVVPIGSLFRTIDRP
jgi:hypothetical protein